MGQWATMKEVQVDHRVIEACRLGDREAFRILFETYKDKVYSIALYFFSGDEAAAKDTAQQVFLKLITTMGQFRGDSEFSTWLYRLVVNACIDSRRAGKGLVSLADMHGREVPDRKSHEDEYLREQVADSVKTALGTLRPKLRMAILLRYFDDLSYEEMAQVLSCSAGTVASRLSRGHKILASRLAHLRGVLVRGE